MSTNDLIDRLRIEPAAAGERRRPGWLLVVLAGVVLLVAAAVWAWYSRAGVPEVRVAVPEIVEADQGDARASVLDASGYVVARRQATVAAEVTGKLTEVLVEEGLAVEKGQVLARIDDATEQAQLALARARLAAARSALAEIEAQLRNARRTRVRQRELKERDLASQSEVDRAETEVESLEARLAAQREQIHVAEREVELQQQRIGELTIRAPFSGVVIARAAQAGEMVSPVSAGGGFTRTGICTIVDMDSLEIEVDVNEAYIDRVRPGQPVLARLDAWPDWEIPAEVKAVVPAADRQKATVRVRVAFVERDPRILPEMGISVRFLDADDAGEESELTQTRRLPTIPPHAVVSEGGGEYVFVVNGATVERRAIRLGARQGDRVLVTAGLEGNERLVANANEYPLSDGTRVRVADD
ncbi:MAG: efflux RND transporter periplasmic adaptor subunit [Wenzhouxiangellaceae bacterium]